MNILLLEKGGIMKTKIITLLLIFLVAIGLFFFINKKNDKKEVKKDIKTVKVAEVAHTIFYAPAYVAISSKFKSCFTPLPFVCFSLHL